jgi:hypothetical protein
MLIRKSLTLATVTVATITSAGCGGSSRGGVPPQYFSRHPPHGQPCPELPDGGFMCNARVTSGDRHSQFTVLVDDVTPSPTTGVAQMNYSLIGTQGRPTRAQALRIATHVAHEHSVVVKQVRCRRDRTGWACQYVR